MDKIIVSILLIPQTYLGFKWFKEEILGGDFGKAFQCLWLALVAVLIIIVLLQREVSNWEMSL